jgi:hypothetical protein
VILRCAHSTATARPAPRIVVRTSVRVIDVQLCILGEERVVLFIVLKDVIDAAIDGVADAIELGWIGNLQERGRVP